MDEKHTSEDSETHFVVGVDFGTTYSGLAYCFSGKDNLSFRSIRDIARWPGRNHNESIPKTPTILKYTEEGIMWGYEAEDWQPGERFYSWIKLLLEQENLDAAVVRRRTRAMGVRAAGDADHGDPSMPALSLPPGKTAEDTARDYFECLYKHLMDVLESTHRSLVTHNPIKFVITVPAFWTNLAKQKTENAARAAGFASRNGDTLTLVAEPEAAAMYVIQDQYTLADSNRIVELEVGDAFIVCDAGGGTCDLITYKVSQIRPELKIEEIVPGKGDFCGSTFINREFLKALGRKIGPTFHDRTIWRPEYTMNGSTLMEKFERDKKRFGSASSRGLRNAGLTYELPNSVPCPPNPATGVLEYNRVKFTKAEVDALFDPTVNRVVDLVQEQYSLSKQENIKVKTVFLVGGFGSSEYLKTKLEDWGKTQNPKVNVVQPNDAWQAVMRGAVWSLLAPSVLFRRLRYNYGFRWLVAYEEGKHRASQVIYHPLWGKRVPEINWIAKIGERVSEETAKTVSGNFFFSSTDPAESRYFSLNFFTCAVRNPPTDPSHPDVKKLASVSCPLSDIPTSELEEKTKGWFWNPSTYYEGDVDFKMTVHSGEILKFTPYWKSKVLKDIEIRFEKQMMGNIT